MPDCAPGQQPSTRPVGCCPGTSSSRLLKDRFYIGEVQFKGKWYPGRHEAIIERALFDRVQEVRKERDNGDGTRCAATSTI